MVDCACMYFFFQNHLEEMFLNGIILLIIFYIVNTLQRQR